MKVDAGGAKVRIRTAEFLIEGIVHVGGSSPGYKRRLSDVLNEHPPFLVVVDAVVRELGRDGETREPERYETFILRKDEIKFALPFD